MGKKIFVSYKYSDSLVRQLPYPIFPTTARHYVDILQSKISSTDHIYKGENDGESLVSLTDTTISSKLGDKIYDSTVTIVFISKGMRENIPDNQQWIPWEVSYSLREQSRMGRISKTNAVLAVVLPDNLGAYDYYYKYNPTCNSTTHMTSNLFDILRKNMFNIKNPTTRICNGSIIHEGYSSFIHSVEWDSFINNIDYYINIALQICSDKDKYNLCKIV